MGSKLQAVITEVDQRSSDIEKILNVITGISDQTNFTALNAANEAARAGETWSFMILTLYDLCFKALKY